MHSQTKPQSHSHHHHYQTTAHNTEPMLAFIDWLRASAADASAPAASAASGGPMAISLRDLLTWAGFVRTMATAQGEGGACGCRRGCFGLGRPCSVSHRRNNPSTTTNPQPHRHHHAVTGGLHPRGRARLPGRPGPRARRLGHHQRGGGRGPRPRAAAAAGAAAGGEMATADSLCTLGVFEM